MKKIALLTVAAVLGSLPSLIASPASCSPGEACASYGACEIKCPQAENVAAAGKDAMAVELTRLVSHYVPDASIRRHLLRRLGSDPQCALDFVARARTRFSEADRVAFIRVSDHFKC